MLAFEPTLPALVRITKGSVISLVKRVSGAQWREIDPQHLFLLEIMHTTKAMG